VTGGNVGSIPVNSSIIIKIKTDKKFKKAEIKFQHLPNSFNLDKKNDDESVKFSLGPFNDPGERSFTVKVYKDKKDKKPDDTFDGRFVVMGKQAIPAPPKPPVPPPTPPGDKKKVKNTYFPLAYKSKPIGYFDKNYLSSQGVQHLGADYMANKDIEVFSVCDGEIIQDNTSKVVSEAVLIIKHDCGGKQFFGHYGHISSYGKKSVVAGEKIGKIKYWTEPWGDNSHLHIGFNAVRPIISKENGNGWGRGKKDLSPAEADKIGWVDPVKLFGW
jgi:hypothetical protein